MTHKLVARQYDEQTESDGWFGLAGVVSCCDLGLVQWLGVEEGFRTWREGYRVSMAHLHGEFKWRLLRMPLGAEERMVLALDGRHVLETLPVQQWMTPQVSSQHLRSLTRRGEMQATCSYSFACVLLVGARTAVLGHRGQAHSQGDGAEVLETRLSRPACSNNPHNHAQVHGWWTATMDPYLSLAVVRIL